MDIIYIYDVYYVLRTYMKNNNNIFIRMMSKFLLKEETENFYKHLLLIFGIYSIYFC